MTTWSSFQTEKDYTDKWRTFLEEGYKEEVAFCDQADKDYEEEIISIEEFPVGRCGHPNLQPGDEDVEVYKRMAKGKSIDHPGASTAPPVEPEDALTDEEPTDDRETEERSIAEWAAGWAPGLKWSLEGGDGETRTAEEERAMAKEWMFAVSPAETEALIQALADIGYTFDEEDEEASLSAEEEEAKQKILGMFEFEEDTLDNVDLLLTVGGIIPGGLGCIMGAANSIFNFSRGEWLWGAFDAVFAVPPICGSGVGEVASGTKGLFKLAVKMAKWGGKSPKVLAQARKAGKVLSKAEKAILKSFDDVVKSTEKVLGKVIGPESATKYTAKYVTKLIDAIKSEKTKEQVNAVVALLPDSFFDNMDAVLNKPVRDIWGVEAVEKVDKLLEDFGINVVDENYENLINGSQINMILYLANQAGVLSAADYRQMIERVEMIRAAANEDKGLSKEERIEKFIRGDDEEEEAAIEDADIAGGAYPGPGTGGLEESKVSKRPLRQEAQLKRWHQLAGINPRVL